MIIRPPMSNPYLVVLAPAAETIAPTRMKMLDMMAALRCQCRPVFKAPGQDETLSTLSSSPVVDTHTSDDGQNSINQTGSRCDSAILCICHQSHPPCISLVIFSSFLKIDLIGVIVASQ
jgi:hypothetical protein